MRVTLPNGQSIEVPDEIAAMYGGGTGQYTGPNPNPPPPPDVPQPPPPQPPPGGTSGETTTPPPDPGTNNTGQTQQTDPNISPFNIPFQGNPNIAIGDAPMPNLPQWRDIPAFKAPSAADALNDPGYQFRVSQGEQGLQNWAAARGTLNSSDTAKALTDYGQNAASQEYGNVWNRQFQGYQSDVQTQYLDPFNMNMQRGLAMWQPQFAQWNATNQQNQQNFLNSEDLWEKQYQHWKDQNYTIPVGLAGGGV